VTKRQSGTDRVAKVISSESVFKSRSFELKHERVIEPGTDLEVTRDIIAHPGSVVVLPVFPDGRILMIRQFRHATGQFLWELVAGHREEHETFLEAVPRELQEETGYTARSFTKLVEFYPSPGLLGEKMEVYLAEGLSKGKSKQEEDEKITQRIFTMSEVEAWMRAGKIKDGKTIASILYYAHFIAAARKRKKAAPKRKKR
jgi:ADP-ribose pyrophosphatase